MTRLLLAGGASRVPAVARLLEELVGVRPELGSIRPGKSETHFTQLPPSPPPLFFISSKPFLL